MASICQDIHDVAQVLEEFYNIFGPELKVRKTAFIFPSKLCDNFKSLANKELNYCSIGHLGGKMLKKKK